MSDYKTKQDVDAEIERLKKLRDELPEHRAPEDGWEFYYDTWCRRDTNSVLHGIASVSHDGLRISKMKYDALDGIAHDDKGRIKVVGYVNAEELRTWMCDNLPRKSLSDFNGRPIFEGRAMQQMWDIIDELAG